MSWTNSVGNLLRQYAGGTGAAAQPAPDVHAHYDEVSKAVPQGTLADGIGAAFKSDRTPAMGQMLANLFSQSSAEQKAGLLNHILASITPSTLMQAVQGTSLAGLISDGKPQISTTQAQQVSPQDVQQLATHAQNNPSFVDSVSNFYAEHKGLVKTLGGGALAIVLARIAQNQHESAGA